MKRLLLCAVVLAVPGSAWAGDDAPYYGPMQRWHGIGYTFGYRDKVERDGSWRIDTAIRGRGEAVDMALYRAAERARAEGYRYVMLLGGNSQTSPGVKAATLYARPSREAVPPGECRSRKATTCYTADVGEILRILGGPNGQHPGVAIVDHLDEYGREVSVSGYGIGAVAASLPPGKQRRLTTIITDGRVQIRSSSVVPFAPAPAPFVPAPRSAPLPPAAVARAPIPRAAASPSSPSASERFQAALKAAQPVHGNNREQGWTASD
ncbi:hypothetical protein [Sphingomonas sp. PAMC 26621]|uniref:hypothetical protein n=1 Tax=Sphingomonas sp. PAMC 26621 TaxID=1112213 RepID=UPI0002D3DF1B|nr:hypothetical protein [Sphingomonas sp. PAMC 26621]